jgi:hypothetical protein
MQLESRGKASLWDMLQASDKSRELWRNLSIKNIEHK